MPVVLVASSSGMTNASKYSFDLQGPQRSVRFLGGGVLKSSSLGGRDTPLLTSLCLCTSISTRFVPVQRCAGET